MIGKATFLLAIMLMTLLMAFTGSVLGPVLKINFDSLAITVGVIVFSGLVGSIGIRRYDKYLLKRGKKLGKKRAWLLREKDISATE